MAKFIRHEACPSCGSRDNLARYSDGSAWCFGCHYKERGDKAPWTEEKQQTREEGEEQLALPEGCGRVFTEEAVSWLRKGGCSVESAIRAGMVWEPKREQLLIPLYDRGGKLVCLQAKNFNPLRASRAKYYNIGDKSQHFTIYTGSVSEHLKRGFLPSIQLQGGLEYQQSHNAAVEARKQRLVLTEDVLSSLRIAPTSDAMPLLGTSLPKTTLTALAGLYKELVVWLDRDKWREARTIADQAKLLGLSAKAVITDEDPKSYDIEDIRNVLYGH